jgi:glycosyltransferase involved in cell wall biosynthesis
LHGDYLVRDFAARADRVVPFGMGYETEYLQGAHPSPLEFTRRPVIGFVGYVYYGHDQVVRMFVAALRRLEQRGRSFTLLTVGDSSEVFSRCAHESGLQSYVPVGRVGLPAALGLMRAMDFGFVFRLPEDVCNINSKLWEYLAANLYVLGLVPPEGSMARLFAEGGCGRVLPYDVEGMARVLDEELAAYAAGKRKAPPAEFTARFSAERMVEALAARLERLAASLRGAPAA